MNIHTLPREEFKKFISKTTLSHHDILTWIEESGGCLVIGVGMLKGGTGKTTSTIYIALFWAIVFGLKVCVVDTDENSQTVENWYAIREARGEKVPFKVEVHNVRTSKITMEQRLKELRKEYDVVIIDTGGADKEAYFDICIHANMLLLPVAPSGYETSRIPASMSIALKAGRMNENAAGLNVFVVMVKCDNREGLAKEQRPVIQARLRNMEIDGLEEMLVREEFQISGATHYPRSYEVTPARRDLEEFGLLMRHTMREVAA